MKSRIVIVLSVTLAVLLLVVGVVPKVMPTSPVLAQYEYIYQYSVPFVCGTANDDLEGVKPANYATTVTIHNPQDDWTMVGWKVVRVFPNLKETSFKLGIYIGSDDGYCIRCKNICNKLHTAWPPPKYITGYVVIKSLDKLDVTGVYTTEDDTGLSIDVEQYGLNEWYSQGG